MCTITVQPTRGACTVDLFGNDIGMTWRAKIRFRALVAVLAIPLAIFTAISFSPGWLVALPIVGVVVAAATVAVQKSGTRLSMSKCWTCGEDLAREEPGEHGIVCPSCGSLYQLNPRLFALGETPDADAPEDIESEEDEDQAINA